MSIHRWDARTDSVQATIVEGLEKAGVRVWVIKQPCDLLCYARGTWQPLEVKTPRGKRKPKAKVDKRQEKQRLFLQETRTPVVLSLDDALAALGLAPNPTPPCTSKPLSGSTASVGR